MNAAADPFLFGGREVFPGEEIDFELRVSETYSGQPICLPVRVWRGLKAGPTVFVTAALHGDEINGTGAIRTLILDRPFKLEAGTLLLVPVVNLLGFERHSRYLPDRRDLNRCFPGSESGSLASRYANSVFREIVKRSDYGIDLHTGAVRRTNFPNVRADLGKKEVRRIAYAFGCALVVNSKGPQGSLRRSACAEGCPTIILEAGEVWKVEPGVVETAIRGIRNVLVELGMVRGKLKRPPYQARVDKTKWVRADHGGMLQFHVTPGDVVDKGQPLATCANLLGAELGVIAAPLDGVVLGMTTLPSVTPGNPVCHLAVPRQGIAAIREALEIAPKAALHQRMREDLATSLTVSDVDNSSEQL